MIFVFLDLFRLPSNNLFINQVAIISSILFFFSYLFKQRKSVALSFLLDSEMFSTVFVSLLEFKSSSKQKKYSLVFGLFLPPI